MKRNLGTVNRCRCLPVLLLTALSLSCRGSSSPTEPPASLSPAEIEVQLFELTNRERRAAQVEPQLALDGSLTEVARAHSRAMRDEGFFGHVGSDGKNLGQRLSSAGVDYARAAENLAKVVNGSDPAAMAHDLLMQSSRHRSNLLDSSFRAVGIGVVRAGDTFWITQIFTSPSA